MPLKGKAIHELSIDPEFRALIRPLFDAEYDQLEKNILADGCLIPLVVWNGVIVDGHNRYAICTKHRIPFFVMEKEFSCREEAIAWICTNQLGRRNISEETRKYLIGVKYESEKTMAEMYNRDGINQYSDQTTKKSRGSYGKRFSASNRHTTAKKIGAENHLATSTVQKYGAYSRDIDILRLKAPDIVPKILSGSYKISHKDISELASRTPEEIKRVFQAIEERQADYAQYKQFREQMRQGEQSSSIKDMPPPDPDGAINGLALTIPSWVSSMERVLNTADMTKSSEKAKEGLISSLRDLVETSTQLISEIGRDNND